MPIRLEEKLKMIWAIIATEGREENFLSFRIIPEKKLKTQNILNKIWEPSVEQ